MCLFPFTNIQFHRILARFHAIAVNNWIILSRQRRANEEQNGQLSATSCKSSLRFSLQVSRLLPLYLKNLYISSHKCWSIFCRSFAQHELEDLKSLFKSLAAQSQSNGRHISPSIFQVLFYNPTCFSFFFFLFFPFNFTPTQLPFFYRWVINSFKLM